MKAHLCNQKFIIWIFLLITISYFSVNTSNATAFDEGWESSSIGTYTPDMALPFIQGDEGKWLIGDTASECGDTPHTAEILLNGSNKSLRLTSNNSNSGCADNIWVHIVEVPAIPLNTGFNVPLTSETVISFEETGNLIDPQTGSHTCLLPPCGDTVSVVLEDNRGNQLAYILQRAPDAVPNEYRSWYREIFLNPEEGFYSRNLFIDFQSIPDFISTGVSIRQVVFQVSNHGNATIDNICIGTSGCAPPSLAPSASFSASPTCGDTPLRVNFTDESSGAITSWNWNFGDGASSVIQNPSHTYTSDGKYSVSLTVSGPNGSDMETKTDYIFVGKISKLESTFDEGVEGWWIYNDGTNLTYHTDGGNPGGYISAVDLALDQTWRFVSPCSWGGDWSSFLGGTISFDIKVISGDTNRYYTASDVIIDTEGTGHYAKWSSGISPKPGSWTHYEVRLSESNFQIVGDRTWDQIISNVTYLMIRGEHIVGPDTEGVDNIRVLPRPGLFSITPILQLLLDDE